MATYRVRACGFCGNDFMPFASRSKHCSATCRFKSVAASFSGDQCWEWPLSRQPSGYGQFNVQTMPRQVIQTAHRMSYEIFLGAIAPGLCVMHKCDNRGCFNPAHLQTGTLGDNNRDMVAKGRHAAANRAPVTRCWRGHDKSVGRSGALRCPTCIAMRKRLAKEASRNRAP